MHTLANAPDGPNALKTVDLHEGLGALADLFDNDPVGLADVLTRIMTSMRTDIAFMREAHASNDGDALSEAAYHFKSMSASLRCPLLIEISTRLQRSARASHMESVPAVIDDVARSMVEVQSQISAYLRNVG